MQTSCAGSEHRIDSQIVKCADIAIVMPLSQAKTCGSSAQHTYRGAEALAQLHKLFGTDAFLHLQCKLVKHERGMPV